MSTKPLLGALMLATIGLACGGDGSPTAPSTPAPTPTPAPSYAGRWTGSWESDTLKRPYVQFTVSGNQIDGVQVDALLLYMVATAPGAFTVNVCESRMTASGPVTYTGNTFEVTVTSATSGGTSILRGTFNSDRTASGRLDAFTVTRGCVGESPILLGEQDAENWTGSKQ